MNITPTQLKQLLLEEIVKESKSSRRKKRREIPPRKKQSSDDKLTPGTDLGDDKAPKKDELEETTAFAGECSEPQHVIYSIVKDMDPNAVAELFQDVFEQLPGVELERPDVDDDGMPVDSDYLETGYQSGGEYGDRPVIGFKEQLMEMIRSELNEI